MAYTRRQRPALLMAPLLMLSCGGCFHSWINDWLDPSEMGAFDTTHTTEIRRSISVLEEPGGLALATDPMPEDLVPYAEEYRMAPGDTLTIRILELLAPGAEAIATPVINEQGSIHIPELGWLTVSGYTARELQALLIDELREQEILEDASVVVTLTTQRRRVFNIFGVVSRAGQYPIVKQDLRLMEALLMAGGFADIADKIYVFRPSEPEEAPPAPLPSEESRGSPERSTTQDIEFIQAGIASGYGRKNTTWAAYESPGTTLSSFSAAYSGGQLQAEDGTMRQPPPGEGLPEEPPSDTQPGEEEAEIVLDPDLLEAILPQGAAIDEPAVEAEPLEPVATDTQPEPEVRAPATQLEEEKPAPLSHWVWLNGKWIEVTPETVTGQPETGPSPATGPGRVGSAPATRGAPVSWEDLEVPPSYRIIAIPAMLLREGDARYNIVVRDNDLIRVTAGESGQYYMMGHVGRPGVYSLVGLKITIKQAVAAAGGLDQLAWPDRCDVVRRIGPDRETVIPVNLDRIFAGQDPDFFLKPNDIVNVGTHAVAPFLATIRAAFRLTYGFGFVWDRNFGDIESQGGSPNPRLVRAAQQQQRLPGLFP